LLREKMGYQGVVITDDMQMGAIHDNFSFKDSVLGAINAGADILILGNTLQFNADIVPDIQNMVVAAVKDGTVPMSRLEESYRRIQELKRNID
ncbi:MAG: glycoside hydrolase family 3 N-terminal domain-containing protein, partial [Bdellovibrionota bacterium]